MFDQLDRKTIQSFMGYTDQGCTSIFMPAHPVQPEKHEEDRLRLKNLVKEAETRLTAAFPRLREPDIKQILLPAVQLLRGNRDFWKHQNQGLALFLSPQLTGIYRLPLKFEPSVFVARRFHTKPLLPLFTRAGRFYILAVCQNEVRLFRAGRSQMEEVEVPGLPAGLAEVLGYDDFEKELQFRTSVGPSGGHGRRRAAFYSHDTVKGRKKEVLRRYCRQIDEVVQPLLQGQEEPLLLASVNYLAAIYRQVNSYPYLFPQTVTGSPQRCDRDRLHREAWEVVAPYFAAPGRTAAERYRQLAHTSQTSSLLEQVLPAVESGLVETLFVALDCQVWGSFEVATGKVERYQDRQPGAEDLLDRAAATAFLQGGTVYAIPGAAIPNGNEVAAIYRFGLPSASAKVFGPHNLRQ